MKTLDVQRAIALAHKTKRPLFLTGKPGEGKSSLINGYFAGIGEQVWDVRLSYRDVTDTQGFPVPDIAAGVTRWIPPAWLPRDPAAKGCLFLDELLAAPPLVQTWAFQITLDRRSGEYVLPDGVTVIAASNRTIDKSVTHRMPSALVSRFWHLTLEADYPTWRAWAASRGIRPEVIAFLSTCPEHFSSFDGAKWQDGDPFACPRTWEYLSDLVSAEPEIFQLGKSAGNVAELKSWQLELIQGVVGKPAGLEFFAYLRSYLEIPSLAAILADPKGANVPEKPSSLFAVAAMLAWHADASNIGAILDYLGRLPREFMIFAVQDAARREDSRKPAARMHNTAAFQKFALENTEIFS